MATDVRQSMGLWLTGEYVGSVQEEDRGEYPGKFKVSLLVGRRVLDVEFKDEEAAAAMLPGPDGDFAGVQRGDVLTFPVGVRSAKGYTFYFGRRVAE